MKLLGVFNRHRNVYGAGGAMIALLRLVIFICAMVLVGAMVPGVRQPSGNKYDPVELFGMILGSLTALHSLLGLFCPGSAIARINRLFESGVVLVIMFVVFLISARMTPGQMPANYVSPGPSKDARMWSGFIAAAIAGVLLLFATVLDFLRRNGPPGVHDTQSVGQV